MKEKSTDWEWESSPPWEGLETFAGHMAKGRPGQTGRAEQMPEVLTRGRTSR
jgi:hypothetical protein